MLNVISEGATAKPFATHLSESRSKLLQSIEAARDLTFIRIYGNIGDDLIYAGTRQLLKEIQYNEVSIHHIQPLTGDTAIIAGGGGWCGAYAILPKYLPLIEKRFKNVIVFPSSYDVAIAGVQEAIENSNALFFAREQVSFDMIKNISNADIAHDCAFFFNYNSFKKQGRGLLNAFREDAEAAGNPVPEENNDISLSCATLDEFLWTIAKHQRIKTDRAHVMIAGALLGKQVEYRSSNYHKLPAIADFALKDFPVTPADHFGVGKTGGNANAHVVTASKELKEKKPSRQKQYMLHPC